MEIKKAKLSDLDAIFDIEQSCFDKPYSLSMIEKDLLDDNVAYFISDYGYISVQYYLDEANLQKIAVKNDFRRCGYGKKLLDVAEKFLKKNSVDHIYLEVNENNLSAINFYEKMGFNKESIRKNYYGSESAIIYNKKL